MENITFVAGAAIIIGLSSAFLYSRIYSNIIHYVDREIDRYRVDFERAQGKVINNLHANINNFAYVCENITERIATIEQEISVLIQMLNFQAAFIPMIFNARCNNGGGCTPGRDRLIISTHGNKYNITHEYRKKIGDDSELVSVKYDIVSVHPADGCTRINIQNGSRFDVLIVRAAAHMGSLGVVLELSGMQFR